MNHGGRTKSVHTCRAKTTPHGIESKGYVNPLSPKLKVGVVWRHAARQGQNVDTSTLDLGGRGARQVQHAVVVVIMSQCLAALGVDTFCPGTVRVRCVWWFIAVAALTCVRAFERLLVHAYASSKTCNHMTMCACTEPRDTRRITAGQPRGQSNAPLREHPRDSPRGNRGTSRGTATGHPKWAPARPPPPSPYDGAELVQLGRTGRRTGHRTGPLKIGSG